MKIPPGVLITARDCAEFGPPLLDALEARYRQDGLEMPPHVRSVALEVAELGQAFRSEMRKRSEANAQANASTAKPCSLGPPSEEMTYSTAEAATKLGTGPRAVQRRAERGTLPAVRRGRQWWFHAAEVDRLAEGVA